MNWKTVNDYNKVNTNTKALLLCGTIACPLFITAIVIEGIMRHDYDSLRYPLSSLSIGKFGWTQVLNFIVTGVLLLCFSAGFRRTLHYNSVKSSGPMLIGLVGIGLTGAGIFVTDPLFGCPTNGPLVLKQFTIQGHLHDLFSMLVFVCLPWACFNFKRQFTAMGNYVLAAYSNFAAWTMIILFICASVGFKQYSGFVHVAGLFQRLCVLTGMTWLALLSIRLLNWHNLRQT